MRRLLLLFLLISLLIVLTSCEWDPLGDPLDEKMTKWESGNFELYVGDSFDKCNLVYTSDDDNAIVFSCRSCYGHELMICTRAENENSNMKLVALYYGNIALSNKYYEYSLYKIVDSEYANIFPARLWFKCVDNDLSEDEVPYEWQILTSEEALKIREESGDEGDGDTGDGSKPLKKSDFSNQP